MGGSVRVNRNGAWFQGTYFALHVGGVVLFAIGVFLSAAAATDHLYRLWEAVNE